MEIETGTILANRYRVMRPLGRGGMGEVFAAENVRTGRHVAIKVLRADTKTKSSAVARFRREARASGSVNSDHVTQVLDVEEDPEHGILIVFELLEGESLIDRLKRTGPIPFDELHGIIEQVWMGLADAHRAGVIHRDLKPSNVFLERRPDGIIRVKILDFGISKLPKEMGGETLTEMGQSLGTFSFMPPEQVGKAKTVDHRADIYAVGTLIFQSLTGQLPFVARNVLLLVEMKTKSTARKLSEASRVAVDPRLEAFVAKTLEREVEDRFQTALEALEVWRSLKSPGRADTVAAPASGQPASSQPSPGSQQARQAQPQQGHPQQQGYPQHAQQQAHAQQAHAQQPHAQQQPHSQQQPSSQQPSSQQPASPRPPMNPNQTVLVDDQPPQTPVSRRVGGTIAMNENPFYPGRQAQPQQPPQQQQQQQQQQQHQQQQQRPMQGPASQSPLHQVPPSSVQRPSVGQRPTGGQHPPLGPLRPRTGSHELPVVNNDVLDTTSDGAATKLIHTEGQNLPAPSHAGTALMMSPLSYAGGTPQPGSVQRPYPSSSSGSYPAVPGSGSYPAAQPQQQPQSFAQQARSTGGPGSQGAVPMAMGAGPSQVQPASQMQPASMPSSMQPSSMQPSSMQPSSQPSPQAMRAGATPAPGALSPPVVGDDEGGADPTRLYRPAERGTTGTTLPAVSKRRGTSPVIFVLGAVVFALVGFALVAVVQYVRTGALPWR